MEASKAKRKRKATAQTSALTSALTPTPRQLKIAKMIELAKECGFACQALTEFYSELANTIASHLVHRVGTSVYQSVSFNLKLFARDAAIQLFGSIGQTEMSEHRINWKLTTIADCATLMQALTKSHKSASYCEGMSRALLADSEITSLVIATIMPTLEATWETLAKGGCRLKVNFMYVLMDADGELHSPKDEKRRELLLPDALEAELRQRVLQDASRMIDAGVPLASGWYRQLGLTAQASAIAACEVAGKLPPAKKKVQAGKAGVTKRNHFNLSHIL